jgi:hypothetical protein
VDTHGAKKEAGGLGGSGADQPWCCCCCWAQGVSGGLPATSVVAVQAEVVVQHQDQHMLSWQGSFLVKRFWRDCGGGFAMHGSCVFAVCGQSVTGVGTDSTHVDWIG